jgi:hypothetical protein
MSSVADPAGLQVDPGNRLLWHFPRRRLPGEAIRDGMLASAGTLNLKAFGPPVVPPLSREELTGLFQAKEKWVVTKDPAEHMRRSVYLLARRTFPLPLLATFDPPETMTSCARRERTIVPTQALGLLNSPLAREQAAAFARRVLAESDGNRAHAVSRAWLLALGRPASAVESRRVIHFLEERAEALRDAAARLTSTERAGSDAVDAPPPTAEQSAFAELCLALFNINEFCYID